MKIDRAEARRIADLAHLEFDDAALDRLAGEMTKILSHIDQLNEVDVEGFEEAATWARTGQIIEPDAAWAPATAERYQRFRELVG